MKRSLLYVSRPSMFLVHPEREVAEIVAAAQIKNRTLGITGAIAYTPDYFAQLLEGPVASVEYLMDQIERDQRHIDVTILRTQTILNRRFPGWSMAYAGASSYLTRQVAPLIGQTMDANPAQIERLTSLLVGLAKPSLSQP